MRPDGCLGCKIYCNNRHAALSSLVHKAVCDEDSLHDEMGFLVSHSEGTTTAVGWFAQFTVLL